MEEVLYHPEYGYYCSTRNPIGREGDFYTSSDLDPVFGKLLAQKFAEMAETIGVAPHEFSIVELGAGRGLLAREILRHCSFPYLILERSAAMWARQRENLQGTNVTWVEELPSGVVGCVFSNEFFDALPVHRIVRRDGILREIYVTAGLTEIEGALQAPMDLPIAEGQLADISTESAEWIRKIGNSLDRGYHLAIDYGYGDREFYARPHGTLMCYWQHQLVEDPYVRVGEQDITAHVNFSELMRAGHEVGLQTETFTTQMDFLIRLGVLKELEDLAPARDAETLQRIMSIKKLVLPDGMGERFKVLIQRKGRVA
jgi:SAM-dependent MidA family methyltransferase